MTATRRLAAILAADVAGYSRLMGADEEGTLERLKALRRELLDPKDRRTPRPHRQDHRRRPAGGICQRRRCRALRGRGAAAMPERNTGVAADNLIELRIGINLGDVRQTAGDDPSVLASSAVVLAALGAEIGAMMALMDCAGAQPKDRLHCFP
jgi:adenylate cyclase